MLKKIKDELKTNASQVTSNLGGGAFGHLGLIFNATGICTDISYSYVRPGQLGQLVLPAGPGVTNLQREIARDQHKEDMHVYREVVDLKKALLKLLVNALPELYTKSFRNTY